MAGEGLLAALTELLRSDRYREFFADLLLKLCAIDTTCGRHPSEALPAERVALSLVASEIAGLLPPEALIEKRPIDPRTFALPEFTCVPHPYRPEEYYQDRCNLVVTVPGDPTCGIPMIYNAHLDTVAPFIPPRREGEWIYGRGAADDKGQVALLVTALKVLADVAETHPFQLRAPRVFQFVIEEESGGNGTLSALLDREIRSFSALVLEVTSLELFPANRGAVWYQAVLRKVRPEVRFAELAARVILQLEEEGQQVRRESTHELFKPHHVQTCHGILGPYGNHPSAVNDYVALVVEGLSEETARHVARRALHVYTERYGDKTKERDPETGKAKVARHLAFHSQEDDTLLLEVFGKSGHMGAIHLCDCALIKAAYVVGALCERGARVELKEGAAGSTALLEGGQGFIPTHRLDQIKTRLQAAALRGARQYCRFLTLPESLAPSLLEVRFEKLHNDAFCSRLDSPLVESFRTVWELAGRHWPEIRGWEVSCDARLFHRFGHDVVVWGVGDLKLAHSPGEALSLTEAMEGLKLLCLLILQTGGAFRQ